MALQEERMAKTQQWQARLARERANLSASVKAALAETPMQENQWLHEREDQGGFVHTARGTALIPPRLSLQSKVLPAVRRGSLTQSTKSSQPEESSSEQKHEHVSQNTNIFARLAQRLTSSLSAFGTSGVVSQVAFIQENLPEAYEEPSFLTRVVEAEKTQRADYETSSTVVDALPSALPPVSPEPPLQSRQRLAGHTAKIKLQTASLPVVPAKPTSTEVREPVIVRVLQRETKEEQTTLSSSSWVEYEEKSTNPPMPAAEFTKGETRTPTQRMTFGSGAFKSGQCDAMILNEQVSASSIVVAILTASPGPTVVQYVSLQPGIGFTAHLTAPASAETPFNYVILSDKPM